MILPKVAVYLWSQGSDLQSPSEFVGGFFILDDFKCKVRQPDCRDSGNWGSGSKY